VELCDRRLIEILLKDENFFTLLGVFGYNPSLIREMDFRTGLEEKMQFKEIIPIEEKTIKDRVHMNYRIHVIKDNVLSRSLPDCSVIMLEHIINENNYHILSYLAETPEYWQQL
jgi:protein phosphatase-4 regulatory subunit 3